MLIGRAAHYDISFSKEILKFEINVYDRIVLDLAFEFKITIEEVMQMPVNHFFALLYKKQHENVNQTYQRLEEYKQSKMKK